MQRKLQTSEQIDCFSVVPSLRGYFWDLVGVRNLGSALDYAVLIRESTLEENTSGFLNNNKKKMTE